MTAHNLAVLLIAVLISLAFSYLWARLLPNRAFVLSVMTGMLVGALAALLFFE
jgi:hypothetical protein